VTTDHPDHTWRLKPGQRRLVWFDNWEDDLRSRFVYWAEGRARYGNHDWGFGDLLLT
jgi:hypothetical protein